MTEELSLDAVSPALKACSLFQALKDEHFSQILKIAEPVRFPAEEVIVDEGTAADAFYVILEGEASIRLKSPAGDSVELGRVPKGATFGEMGLLLGKTRTASVVAVTDLQALKFSNKAFDTMFQKIPKFGLGLSQGLAHRLDEVSGHIPLPKYDARKGIPETDVLKFVHPSQQCLVNQREVGGHTRTFARGLKSALREDPDVVMVGEMRDLETIALALETANTGHLVFATLHTNSAVSTIDRIVDQFPAHEQAQIRSVLADVLRGMVTQTLIKKKEGGRLAALEIMVVNHAIANLIREAKTVQIPSIIQTNRASGMQLLNDVLSEMVETRKIELSEALANAVDKKDLEKRFRNGLTIASDPAGDRFRVMEVKPNSPSFFAGLRRGSSIFEIDGRPATHYSLDEARRALRSDGNHPLTVADGSGKKLKVTMELPSMI